MLKYIRQYAETIQGIDIYPIISMLLFFAFFVGMLWFVKRMSRSQSQHMGALPLEEETPSFQN